MLGFGMRVTATSSLWLLGFFTTCCLAWPSAYRRSYNYYPPLLDEPQQVSGYTTNQWDIAQEPYSYDQQPAENYYVDPDDLASETDSGSDADNTQWSDIQVLTNLMEMYDTAPQAPTWGQIVNEKPESELEELKNLQKHHVPEQQQPKTAAEKVIFATVSPAGPTSVPKAAAAVAVSSKAQIQSKPQSQHHQGQKEVPLLRPPNKPKTVEPMPVLTQRSLDMEKKPSPYDTLRKYLSIEDALKKEAEKRRASAPHGSRQKKRSYVTDEDTLTGQLTNLKKSLV